MCLLPSSGPPLLLCHAPFIVLIPTTDAGPSVGAGASASTRVGVRTGAIASALGAGGRLPLTLVLVVLVPAAGDTKGQRITPRHGPKIQGAICNSNGEQEMRLVCNIPKVGRKPAKVVPLLTNCLVGPPHMHRRGCQLPSITASYRKFSPGMLSGELDGTKRRLGNLGGGNPKAKATAKRSKGSSQTSRSNRNIKEVVKNARIKNIRAP